MAEVSSELEVIIKAKDEASAVIKELRQRIDAIEKALSETNKQPAAKQAKADLDGLSQSASAASQALDRLKKTSKADPQATAGIKEISAASDEAGAQTSSLREKIAELKDGMSNLLTPTGLMIAAFTGLSAAAAELISTANEFSIAVAEISTLVDTAVINHAELSDQVLALSREYGNDRIEVAKAMYQAISAGAAAGADAVELLNVSLKTAIGGVTDVATAVDGLTTVINAFGLSMSEAGAVSDAMFVAMKGGKTTIGELSAYMFQGASSAASMSVTYQELLATVTALTKQGVPTAQAFTRINAALTALMNDRAVQVMKKLGYDSAKAAIEAKGLAWVLNQLYDQMGGDASRLLKVVGSTEALSAILLLTGKSAGYFTAALRDQANAMGATQEAADKMMSDIYDRYRGAWNKIRTLFEGIGEILSYAFIPFLEVLADLAMSADLAIRAISKLFNILRGGKDINTSVDLTGDLKEKVAETNTEAERFKQIMKESEEWIRKMVAAQDNLDFQTAIRLAREQIAQLNQEWTAYSQNAASPSNLDEAQLQSEIEKTAALANKLALLSAQIERLKQTDDAGQIKIAEELEAALLPAEELGKRMGELAKAQAGLGSSAQELMAVTQASGSGLFDPIINFARQVIDEQAAVDAAIGKLNEYKSAVQSYQAIAGDKKVADLGLSDVQGQLQSLTDLIGRLSQLKAEAATFEEAGFWHFWNAGDFINELADADQVMQAFSEKIRLLAEREQVLLEKSKLAAAATKDREIAAKNAKVEMAQQISIMNQMPAAIDAAISAFRSYSDAIQDAFNFPIDQQIEQIKQAFASTQNSADYGQQSAAFEEYIGKIMVLEKKRLEQTLAGRQKEYEMAKRWVNERAEIKYIDELIQAEQKKLDSMKNIDEKWESQNKKIADLIQKRKLMEEDAASKAAAVEQKSLDDRIKAHERYYSTISSLLDQAIQAQNEYANKAAEIAQEITELQTQDRYDSREAYRQELSEYQAYIDRKKEIDELYLEELKARLNGQYEQAKAINDRRLELARSLANAEIQSAEGSISKQQALADSEAARKQVVADRLNILKREKAYYQQLADQASKMTAKLNAEKNKQRKILDDLFKEKEKVLDVSFNIKSNRLDRYLEKLKRGIIVPVSFSQSGSMPGFASGGLVQGAGTGTSDSILARLSNGEYVIDAKTTRHFGPEFFRRLQQQARSNVAPVTAGSAGGFASGGEVKGEQVGYIKLDVGGKVYSLYGEHKQLKELVLGLKNAR